MHNRIREIRKEQNLSQAAFAHAIGISRPAVSLIESGENNPSEQTIRAICREFNIDRKWLESGKGEMHITSFEMAREQVITALRGSVAESRIDAVIQILEMSPEAFQAWTHALEAFRVYSHWQEGEHEKTPE